MEPFFFDADGASLFGCWHEPASPPRGRTVVLANPLGHEYVQFHRVFRQLAILLADAGFSVLRFDSTGCGDSSGDWREWSLERWTHDLEAALREARGRARTERAILVGLRVGGSLAFDVATRDSGVDALVLWDPVAEGAAHVAELRAGHESMLGYAHVLPGPQAKCPSEVLGFPFPDSLAEELAAIDLVAGDRRPSGEVLLVESHDAVSQQPLLDALGSAGAKVEHRRYSNPHLWVWTEDFAKMHVPRRILEAIVDWTSGRSS